MTNNFIKKISKYNDKDLIFIMGDHGWSFDEETMKRSNLNVKENRFKTFFSYKIPKKCEKTEKPNSIVNVMRFALNCSGDTKTNYLKDLQYISFPEGHKHYGKVFDYAPNISKVDSTDIMNLSLSKETHIGTLSLKITNLLDEKYQRPHGYSQDGRNVRFGIITPF